MFNVIKNVISAGNYKFADIQYKIKKMHILGDLTEEQMDELLVLATKGISPDAERPATIQMLQTLSAEVEALKVRVNILENSNEIPVEPETPEYPVWKPWDGMSSDYQNGAIVSHNGELWQSVFAGQNVWEPNTVGTESLWVKYIAE